MMYVSREPLGGSDSKGSACSARDLGSIPVLGRSPGEGNGYLLQYSCLRNPMDLAGYIQSIGSQRVGHDSELNSEQLSAYSNGCRYMAVAIFVTPP